MASGLWGCKAQAQPFQRGVERSNSTVIRMRANGFLSLPKFSSGLALTFRSGTGHLITAPPPRQLSLGRLRMRTRSR